MKCSNRPVDPRSLTPGDVFYYRHGGGDCQKMIYLTRRTNSARYGRVGDRNEGIVMVEAGGRRDGLISWELDGNFETNKLKYHFHE